MKRRSPMNGKAGLALSLLLALALAMLLIGAACSDDDGDGSQDDADIEAAVQAAADGRKSRFSGKALICPQTH